MTPERKDDIKGAAETLQWGRDKDAGEMMLELIAALNDSEEMLSFVMRAADAELAFARMLLVERDAALAALKKSEARESFLSRCLKAGEPGSCLTCGRCVLVGRCCDDPRFAEARPPVIAELVARCETAERDRDEARADRDEAEGKRDVARQERDVAIEHADGRSCVVCDRLTSERDAARAALEGLLVDATRERDVSRAQLASLRDAVSVTK